MPKTKKIHVLTVKLTCHIPVNPGDVMSVQEAANYAEILHGAGEDYGQTTVETRLNRVPAPEPAPEASEPEPKSEDDGFDPQPDDGLDIPDNLRRTSPEPAAAE